MYVKKDIHTAIGFFIRAMKAANNNNELAQASMLIGIARYRLHEYLLSEQSLVHALSIATSPQLIQVVKYSLAITRLRLGKIDNCDDPSWIKHHKLIDRWLFAIRSLYVSFKTRNIRHIINIMPHVFHGVSKD